MSYTFISTEMGTPSGNAAETCALLHLMCFADERDDIEQFAIDCFNDVTGMDNSCFNLYDLQSKAGKDANPAKIGEELATLFENFVSDFSQFFHSYTLFVGGVSASVLEDTGLTEFGFHSMKPRAQKSVREKLIATCKKRHRGTIAERVTDENVDDFLSGVRFVTAKADPVEYIRALANNTSALLPSERVLRKTFTEIRDMQSKLKNREGIAGKRIEHPYEVMDFGRVLKVRPIRLLILERLLGCDFNKDDVPLEFNDYLQTLPIEEDLDDVAEDCQNAMFKQYFNKNDREAFWTLLNEIVTVLESDHSAGIKDVYNRLDPAAIKACWQMDRRAHLYFIATIKDGLHK
ncbi:hypothetical protein GMI70_05825 [Eggerthellaceae bacterium zg-893]|nr:hypothetical protein [Eggerthellaceae bacterium zg-893]